jgi:hypothetical protein
MVRPMLWWRRRDCCFLSLCGLRFALLDLFTSVCENVFGEDKKDTELNRRLRYYDNR